MAKRRTRKKPAEKPPDYTKWLLGSAAVVGAGLIYSKMRAAPAAAPATAPAQLTGPVSTGAVGSGASREAANAFLRVYPTSRAGQIYEGQRAAGVAVRISPADAVNYGRDKLLVTASRAATTRGCRVVHTDVGHLVFLFLD